MRTFAALESDQPWKLGIALYFKDFLLYCFPRTHALIDWSFPPEFLDTELQKMGFDHAEGLRFVDKLAKVRLLGGEYRCVLVHVEIQAQPDGKFTWRMWTYFYRLRDKFQWPVLSLAVLADGDPNWRPESYREEIGDCALDFKFPIFKVLDAAEAEEAFQQTGNPFALLVAAHRAALLTRRDPERRAEERFRLIRYLLRRKWPRAEVANLFKLVSWMTKGRNRFFCRWSGASDPRRLPNCWTG